VRTRTRTAARWGAIGLLGLAGLAAFCAGARAAEINAVTRNRSTAPKALLLAENGAAKMPIVISAQADKEVKARAEELTAALRKITGAAFTLQAHGDGPGIYVGTLAQFPTPSADDGLKIFNVYDGKEAFAIRTEEGKVKLLGATELGVSNAVYRFLEILGCRWFFQSPAWDVYPSLPTLSFDVNETDRPEVLSRYFGYPRGDHFEKTDPPAGEALFTWWRKNRVGKSLKAGTGHCAHLIRGRFQKEFDAHPEYNALVKGERGTSRWGQLCVTNPRVIEMAIQYAREQLDKDPSADMVGVGPDDGGGYCTCPECVKLGDPGNQAFHLANAVARAVQQSHPGKLVGLLAYNWHCDPPDFPLEPNIYVELTTALLMNTKYGFNELLVRWPKHCKYFGLYDYWAVYDWIRDRLPSGRTGNMTYVVEKIPLYARSGICALCAESGTSWGSQGLGYYLGGKLLWNSSEDVETLRNDFYEKAFGPAAAAMKTYYERVDSGKSPMVGPTFYRLCVDDLEKAVKAAAGHPDALARVDQMRQYLVFVYLQGRLAAAGKDQTTKAGEDAALKQKLAPGDLPDTVPMTVEKQAAFDLLRWNYLIRNTYMTFWDFFSSQTINPLARKFGEPTWEWYQMRGKNKLNEVPYRDTKVTAESLARETDAWFVRMKKDYGEVPELKEVRFSNRLALPKWRNDSGKPAARGYPPKQGFLCQGALPTVALASVNGEPLRFMLQQATIYKTFPDGEYAITSADGVEVAKGKLPKGEHAMEVKVPAAGVYYLRYDDKSAGVQLLPDETQQGAFVLDRSTHVGTYNYVTIFFYVPKGTKSMVLYANKSGDKFGFQQPDGKWSGAGKGIKPENSNCYLKADGSYLTIPVPAGMDGKVWSALMFNRGSFHFFNIPNVLSFAADGVLVPEDVAKRDGLPLQTPPAPDAGLPK
jgi:hypothetical protein